MESALCRPWSAVRDSRGLATRARWWSPRWAFTTSVCLALHLSLLERRLPRPRPVEDALWPARPWNLHGSMPSPTQGPPTAPDGILPPSERKGESHPRGAPVWESHVPAIPPGVHAQLLSSPLKAFRRPQSDPHTTGPPLPDQRAASCENSPCRRAPKTAAQPRHLPTGALPPQPPSLPPTWSNWTAFARLPS